MFFFYLYRFKKKKGKRSDFMLWVLDRCKLWKLTN